MKNKSKYKKNRFLFDDCPICQALMKAEKDSRTLTMKETKQAFEKAKDLQKNEDFPF
jgi:hypothetical protein